MQKIKISKAEIGYISRNNNKILLSNLNLSAKAGENIALIGINGSGKSTLLRTIAGTEKLIFGSIEIEGKKNNEYSVVEFARILSIVSSEIISTRYLKVKDLVSLGRFPHQSFSKKQSEKDVSIIDTALSVTGAKHLSDKYISEISDGERQKVMIARALAQDTDILLLDEPTAFLDIENKYAVYKILSETARKQNKCIIFSTHDLNITLKFADKVWLIKDNSIYEGAPEDLILSGVFATIFSNKDVYFNKLTNEFSVKFKEKYPIKLINDSKLDLIEKVTINALKRKSFFLSDKTGIPEISILEDSSWKLNFNKEIFLFKNIYDLLSELQFLFIANSNTF